MTLKKCALITPSSEYWPATMACVNRNTTCRTSTACLGCSRSRTAFQMACTAYCSGRECHTLVLSCTTQLLPHLLQPLGGHNVTQLFHGAYPALWRDTCFQLLRQRHMHILYHYSYIQATPLTCSTSAVMNVPWSTSSFPLEDGGGPRGLKREPNLWRIPPVSLPFPCIGTRGLPLLITT